MRQGDISRGTRRWLLIAAPGTAALVLATREQGRAKSSRSKKKRQARVRQAALDNMGTELEHLADPIGTVRAMGEALGDMVGGSELGSDLLASAAALENHRSRLVEELAIARGETA